MPQYLSATTSSRVIKDTGPVMLHSLYVMNATSGQSVALVASGTSGTWTQSKIIIPRMTKPTSGNLTEIFRSENGVFCADGIWLYFPGALSSVTALVVWS